MHAKIVGVTSPRVQSESQNRCVPLILQSGVHHALLWCVNCHSATHPAVRLTLLKTPLDSAIS